MKKVVRKGSSNYLSDYGGNVSVIFALAVVPLLVAGGVAIDYGRISKTSAEVQSALDSAVLASASKGSVDQKLASDYFKRNLSAAGVTAEHITFNMDGADVVVGKARVTLPMGLMALTGKSEAAVTVTTRAKIVSPTKISKVSFQITNAQGAYDKDIYWFTKDEKGNVLSEELMLTYDYTYTTSGGTKVFTPSVSNVKSATVGSYNTVGQKVIVYEDTTYRGRKVNPKVLWSDDPKAASFTRTTGQCTDPAGQTQAWEDGGDQNYKDFVFTMKCATETVGKKQVRLIQ